ncbi:MAG: B12-binding domain-containing radical SAM protein [Sumerlaeia bacterium]
MKPHTLIVLLEQGHGVALNDWLEVAEGLAALREAGFDAEAAVAKSSKQRDLLEKRLRAAPPALLFLLIGRERLEEADEFLLRLRRHALACAVAVGGPMGTLGSDVFTNNPAVHAIVLGEWQPALRDLAIRLASHSDGLGVPNVWWRGPGGWNIESPRLPAEDLDRNPAPDFEGMPFDALLRVNGRTVPIRASRGCPFSCSFCHVPRLRELELPTRKQRCHSPARLVEIAADLKGDHEANAFYFCDDLFPSDDAWIEEFAGLWRERVHRPFRWTSCAEHITAERMALLAKAGGRCVELGLETAPERARRIVAERNLSSDKVKRAVEIAHGAGVGVALHLIEGFDRNGLDSLAEEDLEATAEEARRLDPQEVHLHRFVRWPRKTSWSDTDVPRLAIAGKQGVESSPAPGSWDTPRPRTREEAARDMARNQALDAIRRVDLLGRKRGFRQPVENPELDLVQMLEKIQVRSPRAHSLRLGHYCANGIGHDVLELRVPTESRWTVELPEDAHINFGVLSEPALPGLRTRSPLTFSIKVEQEGRAFRIFRKVLIQSLDPDSRRWHFYSLPLGPVRAGYATIAVSVTVMGDSSDTSTASTEKNDMWGGWAALAVTRGRRDWFSDSHSLEDEE